MLGMIEAQLEQLISNELRSFPKTIKPEEMMERIAKAVARTIARNNHAIENDLNTMIRKVR